MGSWWHNNNHHNEQFQVEAFPDGGEKKYFAFIVRCDSSFSPSRKERKNETSQQTRKSREKNLIESTARSMKISRKKFVWVFNKSFINHGTEDEHSSHVSRTYSELCRGEKKIRKKQYNPPILKRRKRRFRSWLRHVTSLLSHRHRICPSTSIRVASAH